MNIIFDAYLGIIKSVTGWPGSHLNTRNGHYRAETRTPRMHPYHK